MADPSALSVHNVDNANSENNSQIKGEEGNEANLNDLKQHDSNLFQSKFISH